MASWQDIKLLENSIYEVVEEYLANRDVYSSASLRVSLDQDTMEYKVEIDNDLSGSEDEGIYPIDEMVRKSKEGELEPDIDKISEIANSWIFLE